MAHFYDDSTNYPENFNFSTDVVDYWASKSPPLDALHWISRKFPDQPLKSYTYAHFSRQSHRIALLFEKFSITAGDRLLLILPKIPEWWEIVVGALRCGVVVCPATTMLTGRDIVYRLQTSKANVFIGDEVSCAKFDYVKKDCPSVTSVFLVNSDCNNMSHSLTPTGCSFHESLKEIPHDAVYHGPPTLATDPSLIYFTSGTTGSPKMVLHNQVSYPLAHTVTGKHWLRLKPGKIYWCLTEQGWAKAAWALFGTWNCGATLFVEDDIGVPFDRFHTLYTLNKYPVTTFCGPPTVYRQLVLEDSREFFAKHPPKALEHCAGAGEPLNSEAVTMWQKISGVVPCDGYGQSELVLACGNFENNAVKPGSMGRPSPGVPLYLVDEEGKEVPPGTEGRMAILLRSSKNSSRGAFFGLFDGYVSSDGSVHRPQIDAIDQDGNTIGSWYITGDRASRDTDGYFWFVGRDDDIINSSGYRIGPFEVESVLKQIPGIVESAAVASPDPIRGEVVKAFIVLTESEMARVRHPDSGKDYEQDLVAHIQDYFKKTTAPYKYPRKIEFVDSDFLPKTISGKIKRKELKMREIANYQRHEQHAKCEKKANKVQVSDHCSDETTIEESVKSSDDPSILRQVPEVSGSENSKSGDADGNVFLKMNFFGATGQREEKDLQASQSSDTKDRSIARGSQKTRRRFAKFLSVKWLLKCFQ